MRWPYCCKGGVGGVGQLMPIRDGVAHYCSHCHFPGGMGRIAVLQPREAWQCCCCSLPALTPPDLHKRKARGVTQILQSQHVYPLHHLGCATVKPIYLCLLAWVEHSVSLWAVKP